MPPYNCSVPRHLIHLSYGVGRLTFGTLNVRSLNNKVDVIKPLRIDVGTDVLCLTETWLEVGDAIPNRRLSCEGPQVVERARPLPTNVKLDNIGFTNHGAIVAPNNQYVLSPSTFEHLCVRITSRGSSCVVLLVYSTGSQAVSPQLLTELTNILEHLTTPVLLVVLTSNI